jgi:hypothetical protein
VRTADTPLVFEYGLAVLNDKILQETVSYASAAADAFFKININHKTHTSRFSLKKLDHNHYNILRAAI